MLTDKEKEYEALLLLGVTTDTQDTTGTVLEERPVIVSEEEAERAILSFVGEYDQIPPMYSAVKVDGKKLYELAREGKEIERKARNVHILSITILSMELPRVRIRVKCSKGTYIRTLCHDIGEMLGCGGCMQELVRTGVGHFTIDRALTLAEIEKLRDEDGLMEQIVAVEDALTAYPVCAVKKTADRLLYNGNPLVPEMFQEEVSGQKQKPVRVYDSSRCFVGIYEYRPEKCAYYPVKMFLES